MYHLEYFSNNIYRLLYCNGFEIKYIILSVSNGTSPIVSDCMNNTTLPHGVFHAVVACRISIMI